MKNTSCGNFKHSIQCPIRQTLPLRNNWDDEQSDPTKPELHGSIKVLNSLKRVSTT